MQALTLRWPIASMADAAATMRVAAACPLPSLRGLRSRHFRLEAGAVRGWYQFSATSDAESFAREPRADPAAAILVSDTGSLPTSVAAAPADEHGGLFDRPIFVLAAPRAGGALLAELLAVSANLWTVDGGTDGIIEGTGRLHPATRGWDSHQLTDVDADADSVRTLESALAAELRTRSGKRFADLPRHDRPERLRLIEWTSENSLRVPFLDAAFPDARYVFVHREARQNVSSLLEAWHDDASIKIPSLPGWLRGAWHCLLPERWRDYMDAPLVDVAAFQWAATNQRVVDGLEWLAADRWIAVDYGELVAAPRAVVERVLAFAGLEMDDALRAALASQHALSGAGLSSPIKWRSNPEFRESALVPHNVLRGRLRELGGPSAIPPPPRPADLKVRYSCFLNEVCIEPGAPEAWIVHPSYQFQLGSTVPLALVRRSRFRERFVRDVPVVWVEDAATRVLYPFWARREYAHVLRRLVAGQPPPPIHEGLAAQLAGAGVLVTERELARRREEGEAIAAAATRRFQADCYCVLPSLIQKNHASALARYYGNLIASGAWALGDAQVSQRHGWHNEPVARYFHHQLAACIARVAGEPVRPSYCYVSAYRGGRVSLRPHVDRKQCVFTVSLWIGDATASAAEPWPLWLHSPKGLVSVTQSASDAVLFRGCDLPHWRDQPPPGGAATALILHYVPQDFIGVLD